MREKLPSALQRLKMFPIKWQSWAAMVVVFCVVMSLTLFYRHAQMEGAKKDGSLQSGKSIRKSEESSQARNLRSPESLLNSQSHPTRKSPKKNWEDFLAQFGPGLVPMFSSDGHFVSARGKPGEGGFGPSGFAPDDPEKAIKRARQIISSAKDLLELRSDWPLENVAAKSGSISTQVYFNETHDGLQVFPGGSVKVDLGSHGELLGLYSDYASHVNVSNRVVLDPGQAMEKVLRSPSATSNSVDSEEAQGDSFERPIDGGGKVIWLKGETNGRIAYRFNARGHEFVIDAETGETLSTRDHRNY